MADSPGKRIRELRQGEPLDHPTRRRIMRVLNHRPGSLEVGQVAEAAGETPTMTGYHLRVLAEVGLAAAGPAASDDRPPAYRSAATESPRVLALLETMRAKDEGRAAA
jgi:DNA-binding transcriptional ArsR family regulator